MATLKIKSFAVGFLVAELILLPLCVSQAGAWESRGAAVAGPRGGEVVEGPRGNMAVRGPQGNVAVGTRVNVLPVTAAPIVVGGVNYYVDGGVYYQTDPNSDEVVYVVVPAPQ